MPLKVCHTDLTSTVPKMYLTFILMFYLLSIMLTFMAYFMVLNHLYFLFTLS